MKDWAQLEKEVTEQLRLTDLVQHYEKRWKAGKAIWYEEKKELSERLGRLRVTFNSCKERQRFVTMSFLISTLKSIGPKKLIKKLTLCRNFLIWSETQRYPNSRSLERAISLRLPTSTQSFSFERRNWSELVRSCLFRERSSKKYHSGWW